MPRPTTAPGRADIGGHAEHAEHAERAAARVDLATVAAALRELLAESSPRGQERPLAHRVERWASARWPTLGWRVDDVGSAGGQVVARFGPARPAGDHLLIYSHLDTSLTGGPQDGALTGRDGSLPGPVVDEATGRATGFGLGVAKGPAAAALVGFVAAAQQLSGVPGHAPLELLLASAGTHRSPFDEVEPASSGVRQHLDRYGVPGAAIVAKGGPDGILHEEPGALFLRVRLVGAMTPVLAQSAGWPPGGLPVHLGPVLEVIGRWLEQYRRSRPPVGQLAAEGALGGIVAGRPGKPDLLPARVDLHLYLALLPGEEPGALARDLEAAVRAVVATSELAGTPVRVDAALEHAAASTSVDADVVRSAQASWLAERGHAPTPIRGWSGSTDGVVLRGQSCPTARLGPRATPSSRDPRVDEIELDELVRFARMYARVAVDHALATTPS